MPVITPSSYDPLRVSTSFIEQACLKIPKDGQIDLHEAEQLAVIFLEAADRITDEICKCSAHVGYCEANRRDCKSKAIDNRINGNIQPKVAATIAAQLYGNDADYKNAHEKQALGEAFLDWLRTKYKNLMAAHVLCKDLLKIHHSSREQGNWRGANPHDIDSEPDCDTPNESKYENLVERKPLPGADDW